MAEAAAHHDTDFVKDVWYFAGLAKSLKPGKMRRKEMVGEPVLLGRTKAGEVFALRDICPHRAAPLSAGRLVDGDEYPGDGGPTVECPYHGWRIRTHDGACAAIPCLVDDQAIESERIRVRRYPVAEQNGLVWIYISSDKREVRDPVAPPPQFPITEDQRPKLVERQLFECHVDQAVIGLVDPAHGPFVHKNWWWRSSKTIRDKAKAYAPSELGFTMVAHQTSSNSKAYQILGGVPQTEIAFRLPGLRIEHIENEKNRVVGLTAVTPLSDELTEVTQIFFWNTPILTLLKPVGQLFARSFLGQDKRVVSMQKDGLKYDPNLMLLGDPDMLTKWYYQCKREWAKSRAEQRPFVNPVPETTLRWRS